MELTDLPERPRSLDDTEYMDLPDDLDVHFTTTKGAHLYVRA
ncbi:hypothetical protein [Deinococcus kurensis]|nr:hypothetical protein [Deinococcus kurensis]